MTMAVIGINVNIYCNNVFQALYILSLIYAYKYNPAGPIYDSEGVMVGESYGVTTMDIVGLILFSIVTKFLFGMIQNSLEQGLTPGYTLDIFAINLFSQFLLSFTRYGWWVYSLVPGYIGYKLSGYVWAYIGNTNKADPTENMEVDPKEKKRLAKKERQEGKGEKVKYMKR